jgi:3-hydroxybutyryl-CoA dehydrogenase
MPELATRRVAPPSGARTSALGGDSRERAMNDNGGVEIRTTGVVGLGTMGAGIVEVFARSGLDVVAVEINDDLLASGRNRLESSLGRAVDRGKLDPGERDAMLSRVTFTTDRSDLARADLITEAIPERLDVKSKFFAELDSVCPAETIFATNTSSLPITKIAMATSRPERLVGMHFFNPAPVMRLVEVVRTVRSDDAVIDVVRDLATRCDKTPVLVSDRAGFVANALLLGYLNAAAKSAETGQASVSDIDAAIVAACGLPMGPLTLMDLIGLDVCLDVVETMFEETRDQRFAPSPLLKRLVTAGQLGRKTGRGYYVYEGKDATPALEPPAFSTGTPSSPSRLVGVAGEYRSKVLAAVSGVPRVEFDALGEADVVIVDGGSRTGTSELLARALPRIKPDAVIALAATDEAPVAIFASGSGRAADIVGLHVPSSPRPGVAEVVATRESSADAVATVRAAVEAAGLTAIACRDRPGYIVDYLVLPHLGDAVRMVDDGYASYDDVDAAMTLGCGYADGPIAMLDAVGADNVRSGLIHLAAATHLSALASSPLLDEIAAFGTAR